MTTPASCPNYKTSVHNSTELETHDHNYEPLSSMLVPNVSPPADKADSSQQELDFLLKPITPTTTVHAEENNDNQAADAHFEPYEFINPFCTPIEKTKDHPLEQVRRNPSKPVQTRRQLSTDPEMCMFTLAVSTAKPTNIKEAMADHAWIEAMQEELHQFDRIKV
ncbi:hypothetical protein Tco_0979192 [Tanacetum coccineum]